MSTEKWNLVPATQINNLSFGTSRKEVRRFLGKAYKTFKKTVFSENTTDAYSGYHVYYSADDTLEAVEVFGGVEIILNGERLFPGSLENAKALISDLEYESGSYYSKAYSIGLCTAEDTDEIDSILIAENGYYD